MDEGLDAPGTSPAPAPRARSPLGFALFVLALALGGGVGTLALAAALARLGLGFALGLGALFAVGLPLFLALRLSGTLQRRGLPPLARHLVAALLVLVTNGAWLGISLDWVGRSTGDLFLVADTLVSRTVGRVPLLSGILRRGAEEATLSFDKSAPDGRDGRGGSDGGPLASDAGPEDAAGDESGAKGVGIASAPSDAGASAVSSPGLLSPRTRVERAVAGVVSLVRTDGGGYGAVLTTLDAGGEARSRLLDLTAFAAEGGPIAADAARDGSAAFVTSDGGLVYAGPGEGPRALPALARGATLPSKAGTRSLRGLRDVVIAPQGALLLVGDVVVTGERPEDGAPEVRPALLGYHPRSPGPVVVLRMAGDAVPDAPEGSVATSFALRRAGPAGRVAVVEGFHEGGDAAASDWRLLAGRVDEGALLLEVARTGDAVRGLPERALRAFEEASVLADGRVLFGARFVEEGAGSSLFVGRAREEPVALAAEAVRERKVPWAMTPPTAPHLVAEPDGRFAFTRPGTGIVLADVDRPLEATLLPLGVRVLQREGEGERIVGRASELFRPTLAQGGDWLLVGARLDDGRQALLLLSREDTRQGVAEALLLEGQGLPAAKTSGAAPIGAKGTKGAKGSGEADLGAIRSLSLYQWRQEPLNGTSP